MERILAVEWGRHPACKPPLRRLFRSRPFVGQALPPADRCESRAAAGQPLWGRRFRLPTAGRYSPTPSPGSHNPRYGSHRCRSFITVPNGVLFQLRRRRVAWCAASRQYSWGPAGDRARLLVCLRSAIADLVRLSLSIAALIWSAKICFSARSSHVSRMPSSARKPSKDEPISPFFF